MKFLKSESLAIGLAMFSMFFGAGNIIFPLAVGQFAADQNLYAILGLILTAALMPIAGVIAMILYDGSYRQFFGRIGKGPGFALALFIIALLGPLGSTPRCIALSYTTLKSSIPALSPTLFCALACSAVYLCAMRKKYLLTLLGWILTPVLLGSLTLIILLGFLSEPEVQNLHTGNDNLFWHGLKEGYNTMDLLAAFFFSSTILNVLKSKFQTAGETHYLKTAFKASLIGAFLLAATYIGFSYLAALHGGGLETMSKDALLSALMVRVAGTYAGTLVCLTIAFACLTTAIALITAFADFVQNEMFPKVRYEAILAASLLLTFFVSTFEFTGISAFLGPILQLCYPGLILLTFLNIASKLKAIYGFP
jgi:LIVCS family branched-chain amino acid:cation transporter